MKKISILLFFAATNLVLAQTGPAPSPAEAANVYEELPELKASEILRAYIISGPYHHVREEVPTYSGANRFTIDSQFGVFEAEGNEMLLQRVNEINAIAKLKDVSSTDEYKAALVKAAKAPVAAAKRIRRSARMIGACEPDVVVRHWRSLMSSCDHFLHDLPTGGLQRPHPGARQEPHAFVLIAAVKNVDAVARDRVMKCGSGVLGDESEECLPPWIIGVTKQLSAKLL